MNKLDEKVAELSKDLMNDLNKIGDKATRPHLADMIRQGSTVTQHKVGGYGDGENACALTAAYIAARANGLV